VLIDQGELTTAFPEFIVSRGKGSEMKVVYAEVVANDLKNIGHRDSITGKAIHGVYDLFYPDGGDSKKFTTLSYRTFRYIQLDITTSDEAFVIEKLGSWFTAYPFEKKSNFITSNFVANKDDLADIVRIGWHTARLCAYETYMDCPYWERLQYIGDTRIQALISYYNTEDDRLARNALQQFERSLQYDGLTYSRYPSSLPHYIPNYSLVWVLMVNDFMMYRNDPEFVRTFLPGIKRVVEHFKKYLTLDKMMGMQPYWDFLDHSYDTRKVFETSNIKKLTTNSLFYAHTLDKAAEIFSYLEDNQTADEYKSLSEQIKESVKKQCWDAASKMYADTPDKKIFSMHSNILAVLCGMMPTCHAWSASPNFEILATIAGIESASPEFTTVTIRPQFQKVDGIIASVPHWAGGIVVMLGVKNKELKGGISLPKGITGKLEWEGRIIELREGDNKINLKM